MIAQALRLAGQRLLPLIAPAGIKQFAREAAQGAALNVAVEQGLPFVLGQEGRPLPETLLRSASIGLLGGPAERSVLAGAKALYPGLSALQGQATQRLAGMGVPQNVAGGLAGTAAGIGRLGLGTLGQVAVVEPLSSAVTRSVFPEGFGGGQTQQADSPVAQAMPPMPETMDPAEAEHRRRLELIYARNYKFPSYIHHVSQSTMNPFDIANQMVNVPTVNYF